ncbi:MAG: HAD hydrolase-like protein, partial [Candidatus Hydrogenedentota bacterium]
ELSMSRMKIDPDQMIYVADTKYDTEASKRAGVDCIAVSTGYADREALLSFDAVYVADTILEACDYIIRSYSC